MVTAPAKLALIVLAADIAVTAAAAAFALNPKQKLPIP